MKAGGIHGVQEWSSLPPCSPPIDVAMGGLLASSSTFANAIVSSVALSQQALNIPGSLPQYHCSLQSTWPLTKGQRTALQPQVLSGLLAGAFTLATMVLLPGWVHQGSGPEEEAKWQGPTHQQSQWWSSPGATLGTAESCE